MLKSLHLSFTFFGIHSFYIHIFDTPCLEAKHLDTPCLDAPFSFHDFICTFQILFRYTCLDAPFHFRYTFFSHAFL